MSPATGYVTVYAIEIALLFATLIAIGPTGPGQPGGIAFPRYVLFSVEQLRSPDADRSHHQLLSTSRN